MTFSATCRQHSRRRRTFRCQRITWSGQATRLKLQLIGERGGRYTLTVGRDGVVDFPELGPDCGRRHAIRGGQDDCWSSGFGEQMIGMRASVSMGALRSIQVFVLGEAERPGSYTVSGLSTITNALFASGGVKPIGSLRNIELKRNGQVVTHFDLYDLLLNGDTSQRRAAVAGRRNLHPAGRHHRCRNWRSPATSDLRIARRCDPLLRSCGLPAA